LRGGNGWVLLCLQLADSPFQGIDQVLVLAGDPHFLFDAERSQSLNGGICLELCLRPDLHCSFDLGFNLSLCLGLGLGFDRQL